MDDAAKWMLPGSGEYVEDIIYARLNKIMVNKERFEHSWVLDLDDPEVAAWFPDPRDWEHICEHMPAWPEWDTVLGEYFVRFSEVPMPKSTVHCSLPIRSFTPIHPSAHPSKPGSNPKTRQL